MGHRSLWGQQSKSGPQLWVSVPSRGLAEKQARWAPSLLTGILEGKPSPWPPREQPSHRRGQFRDHLSTCLEALHLPSPQPAARPSGPRWELGNEAATAVQDGAPGSQDSASRSQLCAPSSWLGPALRCLRRDQLLWPPLQRPLLTAALSHLPGLPAPIAPPSPQVVAQECG